MTDFNTVIWNTGDIISQQKMMNMVNNNISNQEHPSRRLHFRDSFGWNRSDTVIGDGIGTVTFKLGGIVIATESFGGTLPDFGGYQGDYLRDSFGGSADVFQFRNIDVSSFNGTYELTIEMEDPDGIMTPNSSTVLDRKFYVDDWTSYITILGEFYLFYQEYLSSDSWKGSAKYLEIWTHGKIWNDFV